MSTQPPSRTRFYLDKRNGKFLGVCAGVADYTGFDVTLIRILTIAAVLMGSGTPLIVYFIAAWLAEDKPRQFEAADPEDQRFWQTVRASPARSTREIKSRLRAIDRRLADIESYVTTSNRSLEREIEKLR